MRESPNLRVAHTQARSVASSMCADRSEIEVAPRGRRSSASVRSRASLAASMPHARTITCRSELCCCSTWWIQCTSSTYGLPRSLQNTVAPSIDLYARLFSLPNSATRLISPIGSLLLVDQQKSPAAHDGPALLRTLAPFPPAKRVVFAGCAAPSLWRRWRSRVLTERSAPTLRLLRGLSGTLLLYQDVIGGCRTRPQPARPAHLATAAQGDAGNLDLLQQQPQLPGPLVVGVQPHQIAQLGQAARPGQEVTKGFQLQRTEHDLELVLALPAGGADRTAAAQRSRLAGRSQPAEQITRGRQPRADELADLHAQTEVVRQNGLQAFGRACLLRIQAGARQLCIVRHGIAAASRRGRHAECRTDESQEAVALGAIEARSGIRVGPRAVEKRDQAVLEQVQEIREGRIFLVAPPLVGMLGQMQGQRAVGAKDTEGVLLQMRHASL